MSRVALIVLYELMSLVEITDLFHLLPEALKSLPDGLVALGLYFLHQRNCLLFPFHTSLEPSQLIDLPFHFLLLNHIFNHERLPLTGKSLIPIRISEHPFT